MNGNASRRYLFRRGLNVFNLFMSMVTTVFGLFWLAWLLWTLISHGVAALNLDLFLSDTPPPGAAGGMANAMIGSLLLTGVGVLVGTPVGLLAGTWLAEYGREGHLASLIRFINDILLSAPSIVIGVFVYGVAVAPLGHFSGWAGGISLAIIMLPVVLRTTEDMMRLVPDQMREAAAALGAPRWKVTVFIVHRASLAGMLTGVILGVARISGETAPLLFTALNNQFRTTDMSQPIANLPVMIFQFAMSPYEDWQHLAWAAALMITAAILILSITARLLLRTPSFGK